MNVLLLVIDSLRAFSLRCAQPDVALESAPSSEPHDAHCGAETDLPRTPFFDELSRSLHRFTNSYATECWTLPAHASMFTGLLPSEHHAHFQTMAYRGKEPTVAEILLERGFRTEIFTRCPIFDGSIPGLTRGFARRTTALASPGRWKPAALLLALSKPRFQRQLRETGFFHPEQRDHIGFLRDFVRSMFPSDDLLLSRLFERMSEMQREGRRYFFFCNLFDVHAPYCPTSDSLLREPSSLGDVYDNLIALGALAQVGRHQYLKKGFRMSGAQQRSLLRRYHDAIELMDERVGRFLREARAAGLLDDTMLIMTADHGEAFGEHELYFHDASVYNTHLRVPLWIHHPESSPQRVDDVVSMAGIFDLIREVGLGRGTDRTLLASDYREQRPFAFSEHYYYPHVRDARECYRKNLASVVIADRKVIVRGEDVSHYDLAADPFEREPYTAPAAELDADSRFRALSSVDQQRVVAHLSLPRSLPHDVIRS